MATRKSCHPDSRCYGFVRPSLACIAVWRQTRGGIFPRLLWSLRPVSASPRNTSETDEECMKWVFLHESGITFQFGAAAALAQAAPLAARRSTMGFRSHL